MALVQWLQMRREVKVVSSLVDGCSDYIHTSQTVAVVPFEPPTHHT